MVRQTHVDPPRFQAAPSDPPFTTVEEVRHHFSELAYDVITLGELQVRLLVHDVKETGRRATVGLVFLMAMTAILGRTRSAQRLAIVPLVAVLGVMLLLVGTAFYRQKAGTLTERIPSGPFAGLYTDTRDRDMLSSLGGDIDRLAHPADSIFFYNDFPAGYLLTGVTPRTGTAWVFSPVLYRDVANWMIVARLEQAGMPGLVVRNERVRYLPDEQVDGILAAHYVRVAHTRDYSIYQREGP